MPIQFTELDATESIYTYVAPDGENVILASARLYQWVQENRSKLTINLVPIVPSLAMSFIKGEMVNQKRVKELALRHSMGETLGPIIFGIFGVNPKNGGPDVYLIDGRHRYVLAAGLGQTFIQAFMLKREEWEPFRIVGFPTITQEQLKNNIPATGSVRIVRSQ